MTLRSIDPATGEEIAEYAETPVEEIPGLVAAAHEAHLVWRGMGWEERVAPVRQLGEIL